MTDSPSAELRTAAATLRKLTAAATTGNWRAVELPPNEDHKHPAHWVKTEYDEGDNCVSSAVVADCPWRQADAAFIAAMHPGVGAALADWLEAFAADLDRATHPDWQPTVARLPLAVARAVNGGQS